VLLLRENPKPSNFICPYQELPWSKSLAVKANITCSSHSFTRKRRYYPVSRRDGNRKTCNSFVVASRENQKNLGTWFVGSLDEEIV
jgi:hypothetical protein